MDDSTFPVPDRTLDLCCGGKKCPKLEATPDGFIVSESETGAEVRFTWEQMEAAIEWLQAHSAARKLLAEMAGNPVPLAPPPVVFLDAPQAKLAEVVAAE